MKESKYVSSHHIQDLNVDSFYRYTKWYGLPVDQGPLLNQRKAWIDEASKNHKVYFESNPYLSFHVNDLYQSFGAKFIFIYRNPDAVIRSHMAKGWYDTPELWNYTDVPGIGYQAQINHSFGRIMPKDSKDRQRWLTLTRAGKIAWMWDVVNSNIVDQLNAIPPENRYFLKIEDFTFSNLTELDQLIGLKLGLSESVFNRIIHERPGKGKKSFTQEWTSDEAEQVQQITTGLARRLGYTG